MFEFLRRLSFKRRVKQIPKEERALCVACGLDILPGEFVGKVTTGEFIHAGYHRHPVTGEYGQFCETGGIGIGIWNGKEIVNPQCSPVQMVFETGRPVLAYIDENGLHAETLDVPKKDK